MNKLYKSFALVLLGIVIGVGSVQSIHLYLTHVRFQAELKRIKEFNDQFDKAIKKNSQKTDLLNPGEPERVKNASVIINKSLSVGFRLQPFEDKS